MQPLLSGEDSESQKNIARVFREYPQAQQLVAALTSSCRKTSEQFLILLCWCPSEIKFRICFSACSKFKFFFLSWKWHDRSFYWLFTTYSTCFGEKSLRSKPAQWISLTPPLLSFEEKVKMEDSPLPTGISKQWADFSATNYCPG